MPIDDFSSYISDWQSLTTMTATFENVTVDSTYCASCFIYGPLYDYYLTASNNVAFNDKIYFFQGNACFENKTIFDQLLVCFELPRKRVEFRLVR